MIDLRKYIDVRVFLVGIALGFVCLSIAGWMVTSRNMFVDYQRSFQNISVESQFLPSARSLKALVDEKLSADKISVIIGGASVFRGAGQSTDGLWSRVLQRELGDRYQVLNLALNGGSPGGQGLYFAEMLQRQGRKVIFVSDLSLTAAIQPDNGAVYRGLYFDAYARGYPAEFPQRHSAIKNHIKETSPQSLVELSIRSAANSVLNFDDFWTYIGYKFAFTIWTPLLRNTPFKARGGYVDSEADCAGGSGYGGQLEHEMKIVAGLSSPDLSFGEFQSTIDTTFQPPFRPNMVLVITPNSPYYIKKLAMSQQQTYTANFTKLENRLLATGIKPITVPQMFEDKDYCDRVHYTRSGGDKLAIFLAPLIASKAKELGYE